MKDIKKFRAEHNFLSYKVFLLFLWIIVFIGITTISGQAVFEPAPGPL